MDIAKNVESIRKLTELVMQQLGPLSGMADFGLNQKSVSWVDGYIERHRNGLPAQDLEGMVQSLGAFLGEAVIVIVGGRWAWIEQQQTIVNSAIQRKTAI